jgi:hypothetical protein
MSGTQRDAAAVTERFRVALDLFAAGEGMMRRRIRREHPELNAAAIEARLADWLRTRPGAEHGDAVGRQVPWPRTTGR